MGAAAIPLLGLLGFRDSGGTVNVLRVIDSVPCAEQGFSQPLVTKRVR
jgi:hypothetical protein